MKVYQESTDYAEAAFTILLQLLNKSPTAIIDYFAPPNSFLRPDIIQYMNAEWIY
jgi:hypothetical protein